MSDYVDTVEWLIESDLEDGFKTSKRDLDEVGYSGPRRDIEVHGHDAGGIHEAFRRVLGDGVEGHVVRDHTSHAAITERYGAIPHDLLRTVFGMNNVVSLGDFRDDMPTSVTEEG